MRRCYFNICICGELAVYAGGNRTRKRFYPVELELIWAGDVAAHTVYSVHRQPNCS